MPSPISLMDKQLITKSFKLMCTGIENTKIRDHLNKDLYYNFFSSQVGDNRYVNPIPQYSPATDPRHTKFLASGNGGMGSEYKSLIDDNVSLMTITAGVPEFTGLLTFISGMFDPVAAIIANKGRAPSIAFYLGQGIGTIAFWPVQLISIGVSFLHFLMDVPRNQYWYVKPAMGMYLTAATNLLNDIATSKGFIKPVLAMKKPDGAPVNGVNPDQAANYQEELARLNTLFPDSINEDGTIDLIRLISRGTRKYRQFLSELDKLNDDLSINSVQEKYAAMEGVLRDIHFGRGTLSGSGYSLSDYLKKELANTGKQRGDDEGSYPEVASSYLDQQAYTTPGSTVTDSANNQTNTVNSDTQLTTSGSYGTQASSADNQTIPSPASPGKTVEGVQQAYQAAESQATDKSWAGQVLDQVQTAWAGGMDAITWRIEHSGPVTDSFSNSTSPSPIADKFNSKVRAVNDIKFDMMGGNTGIPGLDSMIQGAKDLVSGVASSMSVSNIALAMINNSYVSVADHWSDSSVSLHKENYRIRLDSTYAHPYSQLTCLWVPFSLLAPLFMPNGAGGSAYTSPFVVKLFSKSRSIIRTGLVDSATVTIGDGLGGWTKGRSPLNMTIDLGVIDLEKVVSLPVSRAISPLDLTNPASVFKNMIGDVGKYNDYLTRLSGMDYLDTVLKWNKLSNRLTRAQKNLEQSFSASNVAGMVTDSIVGDAGKLFFTQFPR